MNSCPFCFSVVNMDSEGIHINADGILLKHLRYLGANEVADAWERLQESVGFWYA